MMQGTPRDTLAALDDALWTLYASGARDPGDNPSAVRRLEACRAALVRASGAARGLLGEADPLERLLDSAEQACQALESVVGIRSTSSAQPPPPPPPPRMYPRNQHLSAVEHSTRKSVSTWLQTRQRQQQSRQPNSSKRGNCTTGRWKQEYDRMDDAPHQHRRNRRARATAHATEQQQQEGGASWEDASREGTT